MDSGKRKVALERVRAEERKLSASIDKLLTLEEGKTLFKYLHNICGWAQADVPTDNLGRVNTDALQHNATRRFVYAKLRRLATRSLLTPVEEEAETLVREQKAEEEGTSQQETP